VWIEEQASRNERVRLALRGAWVDTYVKPATLARLDRAAGEKLARARPREEWSPEMRAYDDAKRALHAIAGPEWYVLEHPTAEQLVAIRSYRAAERRWMKSHGASDD
jgi:hypothetical protein